MSEGKLTAEIRLRRLRSTDNTHVPSENVTSGLTTRCSEGAFPPQQATAATHVAAHALTHDLFRMAPLPFASAERRVHLQAAFSKARASAPRSCTGRRRPAMASLNVAPDGCRR